MYKNEREQEIINILSAHTYTTVDYLSSTLHISPSSIRRDLQDLENKGLVVRSYGGVELSNPQNHRIAFLFRSHRNEQEKRMIADKAVGLLKDGDIVFIDASSSAFFAAQSLMHLKNITVVTNSIEVIHVLSKYQMRTISTGGVISEQNHVALIGGMARQTVESIHANYTFFSTLTVSKDGFLYDCYDFEVEIRQSMFEHSDMKVFLCDSGKVGKTSAFRQCHISDLDYVVSDRDIRNCFSETWEKPVFL